MLNMLKRLDFTEYEAKTYLALLADSPSTGYAAAKNSGVPRSKIYEVLDNLAARGDILVSHGTPPLYRALSPKALIASRRLKAEENFLKAEEMLENYETPHEDEENIWNITGHDVIIEKARECIDSAQTRVLLEAWAEEFAELDAALRSAAERNVNVTIVSYGEIAANYASVYPHDMSDAVTAEYGGRWLVLSVDDSQVVAGEVSEENDSRAAWTKHPCLVMPITEVIIHDLYIAEIMNEHRNLLEKSFGRNLIDLRRKFSLNSDGKKNYKK